MSEALKATLDEISRQLAPMDSDELNRVLGFILGVKASNPAKE